MCVCLPYNLRNWVVCSKPSSKPLLPIHVIREKKIIKQKNGEIPQPKQPHVLWGEKDRKEGTQIGEEGRNSDTLGERERLFFDPESLRLLWVVLLLPAGLWWLWVKRKRVWGRRNRVCGYSGYFIIIFFLLRVQWVLIEWVLYIYILGFIYYNTLIVFIFLVKLFFFFKVEIGLLFIFLKRLGEILFL